MKYLGLLVVIVLIQIIACNSNGEYNKVDEIKSKNRSDDNIDLLSTKRVLFGHKSVGYNVMSGLEKIIAENTALKDRLSVKEVSAATEITDAAIYHLNNGENTKPASKCDAFIKFLEKDSLGSKLDIALFKFCYVDIREDADVTSIFNYYAKSIDTIRIKYPNLKLIHVTIPLFAHGYGFKATIKTMLKGDPANVNRNRFNKMLKNKYAANDLIYDLAGIESTHSDGTRESFTQDGQDYYALIKEYTYDGGHLNEPASKLAANELLNVLIQASAN